MSLRPTPAQLAVSGAVAFVWVAGLVWFGPWIAHNDFAIFRIALERELDGHVRLVGAHSRLGVFHPGPLREWVFALPYWLSGRRAAGLPATALVLNVGWAIWILAVARRLRPATWGAVCAIGLLVLTVALGPDLASPWNPHLAILPLYLGCWSVVTVLARRGDGWVAGVCGLSFAAQLHASALIVAGCLLAATLIALAVHRRRTSVFQAFGLVTLLWSGPIVDLRKGTDANLIRLGTVGADGDSVGLRDALGHVSRLLWPGTPLRRVTVRPSVDELLGFHRWWLVLVVIALVAISVRSVRWGRIGGGDESGSIPWYAGMVALGALAVGVLSVALFVEPAFTYLYGPLQAVAVFAVVVVAGGVLIEVERAVGSVRSAAEWVVRLAPIGFVAVLVFVPRHDAASDERRQLDLESAVSAALLERPEWHRVEAIPLNLRGAGDLDAEVLDVVLRHGIDARSRRPELGLPAPDAVDGVFGVAMASARDCLLDSEGADEIVRGTSGSGETFSIVAAATGSVAYDRCIGDPAG